MPSAFHGSGGNADPVEEAYVAAEEDEEVPPAPATPGRKRPRRRSATTAAGAPLLGSPRAGPATP
eukprot:8569456-Prorocentrum_lima.AAC.1